MSCQDAIHPESQICPSLLASIPERFCCTQISPHTLAPSPHKSLSFTHTQRHHHISTPPPTTTHLRLYPPHPTYHKFIYALQLKTSTSKSPDSQQTKAGAWESQQKTRRNYYIQGRYNRETSSVSCDLSYRGWICKSIHIFPNQDNSRFPISVFT